MTPAPGHDTLSNGTALPPGNSERIRAKFGSYGIEVLENSPDVPSTSFSWIGSYSSRTAG